jgi:hypothetical protein
MGMKWSAWERKTHLYYTYTYNRERGGGWIVANPHGQLSCQYDEARKQVMENTNEGQLLEGKRLADAHTHAENLFSIAGWKNNFCS